MVGSYGPPLPPEICREILARLPVKSILRYRSVCKSCYSLISCSDFISYHSITNLHKNNGNRLLLRHKDSSYSSHDMNIESSEHDCDYDRSIGQDFGIVGSCNGLICLSKYDYPDDESLNATFLIWNPAIRKTVELPPLTYCNHLNLIGFGFDSNTSDYKVLCDLRCRHSWEENIQENACQIIDLSKGVWRSSPVLPDQSTVGPEAECYANGALHWSVPRYDWAIGRSILSFSMSDESFREIRVPDCKEFITYSDDYHRMESRCVALGGLLLLIVWKERDDRVIEYSGNCSIWTMKEYGVVESWIKVSNVDLQSALVSLNTRLCPSDFILRAKHEILMLHYPRWDDGRCNQDLVLFNTESKKSKRLFCITKNIRNSPRVCKQLCLYKESLVLM